MCSLCPSRPTTLRGFEFREEAVQFERVGRGVRNFGKTTGKAAPQRANHAGFYFFQGKEMSQPVCAGGFAVGAGDAAHPHRFGGPAVELVREKSCLRPEVLEARVGHLPTAVPGETVAELL